MALASSWWATLLPTRVDVPGMMVCKDVTLVQVQLQEIALEDVARLLNWFGVEDGTGTPWLDAAFTADIPEAVYAERVRLALCVTMFSNSSRLKHSALVAALEKVVPSFGFCSGPAQQFLYADAQTILDNDEEGCVRLAAALTPMTVSLVQHLHPDLVYDFVGVLRTLVHNGGLRAITYVQALMPALEPLCISSKGAQAIMALVKSMAAFGADPNVMCMTSCAVLSAHPCMLASAYSAVQILRGLSLSLSTIEVAVRQHVPQSLLKLMHAAASVPGVLDGELKFPGDRPVVFDKTIVEEDSTGAGVCDECADDALAAVVTQAFFGVSALCRKSKSWPRNVPSTLRLPSLSGTMIPRLRRMLLHAMSFFVDLYCHVADGSLTEESLCLHATDTKMLVSTVMRILWAPVSISARVFPELVEQCLMVATLVQSCPCSCAMALLSKLRRVHAQHSGICALVDQLVTQKMPAAAVPRLCAVPPEPCAE
jgi:hypothetical protein